MHPSLSGVISAWKITICPSSKKIGCPIPGHVHQIWPYSGFARLVLLHRVLPFMNMMLWALILAVTLYPSISALPPDSGKTGPVVHPAGPAGHPAHHGPHRCHARLPGRQHVSALTDDKVDNNTLVIPAPSRRHRQHPADRCQAAPYGPRHPWICRASSSATKPQLDMAKQTVTMLASMGAACWASSPLSSWLASSWPGAPGAIGAERIAMRITDERKGP